MCLYIDAESPSRDRSVLPVPDRIDGETLAIIGALVWIQKFRDRVE